ncbi:unnamed protein product [Urochloa humidicola]
MKVEEELKHMIDDKWDWRVRQTAEKEYVAVFPSKSLLTTLSKSSGLNLDLHKLFVKITKANAEASASSVLQTGWVKIYNVPDRSEEAVRLIAELAGEVEVVDELSLIREGPVRVKLHGRDINSLRGYIKIFVGKIGRKVRFVAEGALHQPTAKFTPHKQDEDTEEDEDEGDKDNELEWVKMKRKYDSADKEASETTSDKPNEKVGKQQAQEGQKQHKESSNMGDKNIEVTQEQHLEVQPPRVAEQLY